VVAVYNSTTSRNSFCVDYWYDEFGNGLLKALTHSKRFTPMVVTGWNATSVPRVSVPLLYLPLKIQLRNDEYEWR